MNTDRRRAIGLTLLIFGAAMIQPIYSVIIQYVGGAFVAGGALLLFREDR